LLFGLVLTSFEAVPVSLFVYSFIGSRSIEWGMLAAASTAMIIPVVIF